MNVQNSLQEEPRRTFYCYVTQWFNIVCDQFPIVAVLCSRFLGWFLTTPYLRPYNEKIWARNQKLIYNESVAKHGDLLAYFTRDANLDLIRHRDKLLSPQSCSSDCSSRPQPNTRILSPVEGTIVGLGKIDYNNNARVLTGKFNINAMLKEDNVNFHNFPFMVIFLAPTDIHGSYFPFDFGKILDIKYIYGKYLLTNPYAIQYCCKVYEKNYRVSFKFELNDGSIVWIVMISANLVGIIETNLKIGDTINFGDKIGHFLLGSTIVIVTDNQNIKWVKDKATKVDLLDEL